MTEPLTWIAGLLFFLGPAAAQEATPSPAKRPNIVLIVADDLGVGELGCYGQEKIQTPRIDAMAREGLRFTQFYAAAPVCAPTRCSLMTGLHGGHAFVRDNFEMWGEGQLALPADTQTLPKILQGAGHATAMVGKWGLGGPKSSGEPNAQGFDQWFGYYCQRQAQTFYPGHLWRDGKRVRLPGNRADGLTGTQYAHDLFLEEVERFLGREHDEPFFLYLPFTLPHLALQPEAEDLALYAGRFEERPYRGQNGYVPHETPRAAYAARVSRLDRDVGRVLDLLRERGLEQDTLVLFMSDNGPTPDGGGVDTRFFDSTGGLRGRKGTLYEGGIRVPLIARWPGKVPAGATSAWLAAHYDLLPTLLEIAGVGVPASLEGKLDGASFAPILLGTPGGVREHEFLYWEFHGYGGQQAVRLGRWKGIRTNLHAGLTPLELYDLEADPGETKDLAAEHPEVVARLHAILAAQHRPSREFPFRELDRPAAPGGGGF